MRLSRIGILAAVPLVLGAALLAAPTHSAAAGPRTLVVATPAPDDLGAVPCVGTNPATCATLRDAVVQANTDTPGDTISLGAGEYQLSSCTGGSFNPHSPSDGALAIENSMTIQGAGSGSTTIDAPGTPCSAAPWNDPLIATCDGLNLTISGVTLSDGDASGSGPSQLESGGAVNVGDNTSCDVPGGPDGSLTMTDVKMSNNEASDNSGGGLAAGFDDDQEFSVSLSGVTFATNTAKHYGGAMVFGDDDGATLTMQNVWATGNRAACGGGDCAGGAFAILDSGTNAGTATNVLIENNKASNTDGLAYGGGIYQTAFGDLGPAISWNNVTLDGNAVTGGSASGGAMYATSGTTANLTNVTATNNSAAKWGGAVGIGIPTATVNIDASTIDGNTTSAANGAALYTDSGPINVKQTILNGDTSNGAVVECATKTGGTIASGGYNLVDDSTCGFSGTGDTQSASANPELQPLETNAASSTQPPDVGAAVDDPHLTTQALGTGSVAIDAVPTSFCPPPGTDARGVARPVGPKCDIGAYETGLVVPLPPTGAATTPHYELTALVTIGA
ncbi:MAG: hypothetical protein JOY68_07845, partial [Candidatus Dormibacteraeota bacterium]|nr:hypothetical protein [Candidatus Dormibacteraeota bacterium]